MMRVLCLIAGFAALSACTDPLDLEDAENPALERASYPTLVPIEQLLDDMPAETAEADARTADQLAARAARLQRRAAGLRPDGIDAETRRRLEAGIDAE